MNQSSIKKKCSYAGCNNQAEFYCGKCCMVDYCSVEHQKLDWVLAHRKNCGSAGIDENKQKLISLYNKRNVTRREYFDHFLSQRIDQALLVAKELEDN